MKVTIIRCDICEKPIDITYAEAPYQFIQYRNPSLLVYYTDGGHAKTKDLCMDCGNEVQKYISDKIERMRDDQNKGTD